MVTGRGLEFATAREIALKLTELCRLGGVAMTATDLAHGPVAALDARFPVWVAAGRDAALEAVREAAAAPRERARRSSSPARRAAALGGRHVIEPPPSARSACSRRCCPCSRASFRRRARAREGPRSGRAAQPAQGHLAR